jgi:hypothetical protein
MLAVALLAAACAGGAAPTTSVTPTGAAPTPTGAGSPTSAPTASPTAATTVSATTAPPTQAGPVDVAALIPAEVGGIALTAEVVDINDFMGAYDTFAALLGVLGKSPSDVTIVQAQGSNQQTSEIVIVQAFRIAEVDATALMDGMVDFWKVPNDVAAPVTIAGKQLIVQGSPNTEAQYKSYFYGYGDIVFRLGYNGDNFDAMMAELVSQLP